MSGNKRHLILVILVRMMICTYGGGGGGDEVEVFSGSQADLEGAADNLFSSQPRSKPLQR